MNYGELKTKVISDCHREADAKFVAKVPEFIRGCEGLIRRKMTSFPLSTTIEETARVEAGLYQLPTGVQVIRTLRWRSANSLSDGLARVSPDALNRTPVTTDPVSYAQLASGLVDIRGNPPTDAVFDLLYLGQPAALVNDADTNQLLDEHEMLYVSGAKFYGYLFTQDLELAQAEADQFNNVVETLNEQTDRALGGAQVAEAYNFSNGSSY